MLSIVDYCKKIDPSYRPAFDILQEQGKIKAEATSLKDLVVKDREKVRELEEDINQSYMAAWRDMLPKSCRYKKPLYVNIGDLEKLPEGEQLYILPCFLPPGKHTYLV